MDFLNLLNILYGKDFTSILSVLNSSVYVTKHSTDGFVMHTGFSFSMHTGKKMDILYCIDTGTIILSPKTLSQIPQLAGLLLQKVNGSYLNGISRFYFPILSEVPKKYIIKDLESYLSKKPDQIFIINEDTQEEISIDSFRISSSLKLV